MRRIAVAVMVLMICAVVLPGYARAEIGGSWDVVGTEKISFSAKGLKTVKETLEIDTVWRFGTNAVFAGDDFNGNWTQKKKNFTVYVSWDQIKENYENIMSYMGHDVTAVIKKVSVSGKEQKDGSIKGAYSITANLVFLDRNNAKGKITVKGTFTGIKFDEPEEPPITGSNIWGLNSTIWDDDLGYVSYSNDQVHFDIMGYDISGYFLPGGQQGSPQLPLTYGRLVGSEIDGVYYGTVEFEFTGNDGLTYRYSGQINGNSVEGSWSNSNATKFGFFTGSKLQ